MIAVSKKGNLILPKKEKLSKNPKKFEKNSKNYQKRKLPN
jgi:hypothetical protein